MPYDFVIDSFDTLAWSIITIECTGLVERVTQFAYKWLRL